MDSTDERMDRLVRVWKATLADGALLGRIEAVDEALARSIAEPEAGERAHLPSNGRDDG